MKKVWVHKAKSFREAGEFDLNYYLGMSAQERVDTVQFLREHQEKYGKKKVAKHRKGLRRVFKIIKQA